MHLHRAVLGNESSPGTRQTAGEPPHQASGRPPPPTGFTIVDVLAMGAAGHAIGVGIVLGLRGIGAL